MASSSYGFANGLLGNAPLPGSYMPRTYDTGAISPAAVNAASVSEQTFTVTGLTTQDAVIVNKPTSQANIGIVNARVSAANTLAITFMNNNAASSRTPTAGETYKVIAVKCA